MFGHPEEVLAKSTSVERDLPSMDSTHYSSESDATLIDDARPLPIEVRAYVEKQAAIQLLPTDTVPSYFPSHMVAGHPATRLPVESQPTGKASISEFEKSEDFDRVHATKKSAAAGDVSLLTDWQEYYLFGSQYKLPVKVKPKVFPPKFERDTLIGSMYRYRLSTMPIAVLDRTCNLWSFDPNAREWSFMASTGKTLRWRDSASMVVMGGVLYRVGGQGFVLTEGGHMRSRDSSPKPSIVKDGKLFVLKQFSEVVTCNLMTMTEARLRPMRMKRAEPVCVRVGKEIWIIGGRDNSKTLCDVECFQPMHRWRKPKPMNHKREKFAAAAVIRRGVVCIGGCNRKGMCTKVEFYDFRIGDWIDGPTIEPRLNCAATAVGNFIVVIGGHGVFGKVVEFVHYDDLRNQRTRFGRLPDLNVARQNPIVGCAAGQLIVFGGEGAWNSMEVLDIRALECGEPWQLYEVGGPVVGVLKSCVYDARF